MAPGHPMLHRQSSGEQLSLPARVLAAAEVLAALTAARLHREAMDLEKAAGIMHIEVAAGRLDPKAVTSVLTAAYNQTARPKTGHPGGLTDREVELLRLLARGYTNRLAGEELLISPKGASGTVITDYDTDSIHERGAPTPGRASHLVVMSLVAIAPKTADAAIPGVSATINEPSPNPVPAGSTAGSSAQFSLRPTPDRSP